MRELIRRGALLLTSDGERIGQAKEVRGHYVRVDASGQPDYWLPIREVAGLRAEEVRFSFDRDHLGDHKVDDSHVPAA